jgi:hypothetical protein
MNEFQLAEAYIELTARDQQWQAVKSRTEVGLQKLGKSIDVATKHAQRFLFVFGGAAAMLLKVASDVEESQSKFLAVFKDQADAANRWAEEHAKAVNRSKYDLMGYMVAVQDTFVPLGFAREEAADFSKQLTKLAVDLASFNNASEPETIQLLTSALVGNHDAVRRFGVIITETTLKQELLAMGIDGTTRAATEMDKVVARLNIIMRSTTDAQGDAARTSDSLANQWKALKGDLQELAVGLGQELMPVAKEVIASIRDLVKSFKDLSPEVKRSIIDFGLYAAKIALVVVAVGKLKSALGALGAGKLLSLGLGKLGIGGAAAGVGGSTAAGGGGAALAKVALGGRPGAPPVLGIPKIAAPLAAGKVAGGAGLGTAATVAAPIALAAYGTALFFGEMKSKIDKSVAEVQERFDAENKARAELEQAIRSEAKERRRFRNEQIRTANQLRRRRQEEDKEWADWEYDQSAEKWTPEARAAEGQAVYDAMLFNEAMEKLLELGWENNFRELHQAIDRTAREFDTGWQRGGGFADVVSSTLKEQHREAQRTRESILDQLKKIEVAARGLQPAWGA